MATQINKKTVTETKDSKGKVIKKIILEYEPIDYCGVENIDDDQKRLELAKEATIKRIKIAELKDDKWDFKIIDSSTDIQLWIFENDS